MIIVSLTSAQHRLPHIEPCLRSLLDQSRKPDEIRLYLSRDPWLDRDTGVREIPSFLEKMEKGGEIRLIFVAPNTGPYRKIMPAAEEFRGRKGVWLITADDDWILPNDWLETFTRHMNEPQVLAYFGHSARFPFPYALWANTGMSFFAGFRFLRRAVILLLDRFMPRVPMAVGAHGVAYPLEIFDADFYSKDYARIAPTTDDIWINRHIPRSTPIRLLPAPGPFTELSFPCKSPLCASNLRGLFISANQKAIYRTGYWKRILERQWDIICGREP